MTLAQLLGDKREEILRIAAQHGATNVRVFGSVARGEAGPDSDVDFLVDAGPGRSAFFFSRTAGRSRRCAGLQSRRAD